MTKTPLKALELQLAICRLDPLAAIPTWALQSDFFAITKTATELSIVCAEAVVPTNVRVEPGWRAFMVLGPLDFSLVGILASILQPLAEYQISVFAISTYDTDYILVKDQAFARACTVLGVNCSS